MSDRFTAFMKASAEGAKAKHDWLTAHDKWLREHDKRLNRLRLSVIVAEVVIMVLILREIGLLG